MRRNIEQIEIKEPPVKELQKKRSCFKRTCFTGCGCVAIFIVASVLLVKLAAEPKEKKLEKIPANINSELPIYDTDGIEEIIFISGKEKGRGLEIAAFVPKLIISPIIMMMNDKLDVEENNAWKNWLDIIKEPVADHRDTLKIEWTDMPAEPWFIQSYYETELKKVGYKTNRDNSKDDTLRKLNFTLKKMEGVLTVKDEPTKNGTDYILLEIKIPQKK